MEQADIDNFSNIIKKVVTPGLANETEKIKKAITINTKQFKEELDNVTRAVVKICNVADHNKRVLDEGVKVADIKVLQHQQEQTLGIIQTLSKHMEINNKQLIDFLQKQVDFHKSINERITSLTTEVQGCMQANNTKQLQAQLKDLKSVRDLLLKTITKTHQTAPTK